MGKVDIGVGDEFPVDEPAPPSPEDEEMIRAARQEWHKQREEWRRRKDEWQAQRDTWREEMRARRDAFRSDLRQNLRENFGYRTYGRSMPFFTRVLIGIAMLLVVVALLPFLFMFAFIALAGVLVFFALARGRRSDFSVGHDGTTQPSN